MWNALDSEKDRGGAGGGSANPSPEPGMRWRRGDSDTSAPNSRAATPSGVPGLLGGTTAAGAQRSMSSSSMGRGPAAGPSGRYSSSGLQSGWASVSPPPPAVAGGMDSSAGAAAGNTGGSTGSSPRSSSLKDRAKLVREYVKLRSTNTTPQGSTRGDSYASGRVSAGSEGAGATTAAAAGLGAGTVAAGAGTSLWRLRSTSPSEPGSQGDSLQPSPLLGGSGAGPSPLMGGVLGPSPLMGGSGGSGVRAGLGSPIRGARGLSESSLPPSPVMPESPRNLGTRLSDASAGDTGGGGVPGGYPGSTTTGGRSRLRRNPTSASGSAASSPRAPVGIASTEFRRRGSTASPLDDEIEPNSTAAGTGGASTSTTNPFAAAGVAAGVGAGLAGLRSGSQANRSLNYRDPSQPGGVGTGGAGAPLSAAGAGGVGSSSAGGAAATTSAAGLGSAGRVSSMTASRASSGGAAATGAAAAGAAGFLGSLFGEHLSFWVVEPNLIDPELVVVYVSVRPACMFQHSGVGEEVLFGVCLHLLRTTTCLITQRCCCNQQTVCCRTNHTIPTAISLHSAGIKKKQAADVEAPPSPKRQPAAAATVGSSPSQSLRAAKQQQQQDVAPVYDHYGSSYRQNGSSAAGRYERDQDDWARSGGHQPYQAGPAHVQRTRDKAGAFPSSTSSKLPRKDSHINCKRMFWALLLMLALAGVGVGIWAGVTYGRKNAGGGPPPPALKPTNFTMNLAAGSKNSNGQVENCTDWFSNPTVRVFVVLVSLLLSRALRHVLVCVHYAAVWGGRQLNTTLHQRTVRSFLSRFLCLLYAVCC